MKDIKEIRVCKECHKEYIAYNNQQKYCSRQCERARHKNNVLHADGKPLDSSKVGTVAELLVCTDLVRKGFDVFRAVSPSSGADLVAIKKSAKIFLEVRTAQISSSGNLTYLKTLNCDYINYIACVVHKTNNITYIPLTEAIFDL